MTKNQPPSTQAQTSGISRANLLGVNHYICRFTTHKDELRYGKSFAPSTNISWCPMTASFKLQKKTLYSKQH